MLKNAQEHGILVSTPYATTLLT